MRRVVVGCCLLLLACGSSTSVRTQYLLRAEVPPPQTVRSDASARISMGRITVAPYLDQFGIVIETEEREVRAARDHRWAEPLADGLRLYLRDEIASALGEEVASNTSARTTYDYVVDVFVEQLHGTRGGQAVLVASFRIEGQSTQPGKVVERRFASSKALDRNGYAGLVEAEVALLRQLAVRIAEDLPKADNAAAARH